VTALAADWLRGGGGGGGSAGRGEAPACLRRERSERSERVMRPNQGRPMQGMNGLGVCTCCWLLPHCHTNQLSVPHTCV
jgi:hypothetical protein